MWLKQCNSVPVQLSSLVKDDINTATKYIVQTRSVKVVFSDYEIRQGLIGPAKMPKTQVEGCSCDLVLFAKSK